MDDYEYCAQFAESALSGSDACVLDYGCGAGEIVQAMRARGLAAFGCDVFYGGGDSSKQVPEDLWQIAIKPMAENRIPFPDAGFDLVVSNQVMEHVPDLEHVLGEIHRVLKPGGKLLSLFPDVSVIREGHCGIPYLHRFPKKSRVRIYYGASLRSLGFGYHPGNKSPMKWSADFCDWLDEWTYYRPYAEIVELCSRHFERIEHLEVDHWDKRFGGSHWATRYVPARAKRVLHRKLAGLVFACVKAT